MVRSFWMRNPLLQKNWWNSFFPTCKRKGGQRPWGYFCWGIFKWHFHRTDFLYTFNPPKGTWWKWIPMRMKHGAQQYSYTHLCVRDPIHIIYTCGVCLHNVYITKYTYNMYIYIHTHMIYTSLCQWYACKTKPNFVETLTFTYLPEEFPSFANQQKTSTARGLLLRKLTCPLKNSGWNGSHF